MGGVPHNRSVDASPGRTNCPSLATREPKQACATSIAGTWPETPWRRLCVGSFPGPSAECRILCKGIRLAGFDEAGPVDLLNHMARGGWPVIAAIHGDNEPAQEFRCRDVGVAYTGEEAELAAKPISAIHFIVGAREDAQRLLPSVALDDPVEEGFICISFAQQGEKRRQLLWIIPRGSAADFQIVGDEFSGLESRQRARLAMSVPASHADQQEVVRCGAHRLDRGLKAFPAMHGGE
jgi:hypothetical protein